MTRALNIPLILSVVHDKDHGRTDGTVAYAKTVRSADRRLQLHAIRRVSWQPLPL